MELFFQDKMKGSLCVFISAEGIESLRVTVGTDSTVKEILRRESFLREVVEGKGDGIKEISVASFSDKITEWGMREKFRANLKAALPESRVEKNPAGG